MTTPTLAPAVTRVLTRLVERNATAHHITASRAYTTMLDNLPHGYAIDPTTPGMWQLTTPAGHGGWAFLEGPSVLRLHRAAWRLHEADHKGLLLDALTRSGAHIVGGEQL